MSEFYKPQPKDEPFLLERKRAKNVVISHEKDSTTEKLYKKKPQRGYNMSSTSTFNVGQTEYMCINKIMTLLKKTSNFEDESDGDFEDETGIEQDIELYNAVTQGNIDKIHQLIKEGCDINKRDIWGQTALILAAKNGHEGCVKALIEAGADLEKMDWKRGTALMLAAENGHEDCVKDLTNAGADIEKMDWKHKTALMLATQYGHERCVKALASAGAELEKKDGLGQTVLMYAAKGGHEGCVKALIASLVDLEKRDEYSETALLLAAQNGHEGCVKALINAGADLEKEDYTCKTALMYAVQNGHEGCVKTLIDAGADLEKDRFGKTALILAAQNGHKGCVKALIDVGADLEKRDVLSKKTALMYAADNGHEVCVKTLIDAGANLEKEDDFGHTASELAFRHGHKKVIALLETTPAKDETSMDIVSPPSPLKDVSSSDLMYYSKASGSHEKESFEIKKSNDCSIDKMSFQGTALAGPEEEPVTRHDSGTKLIKVSSKGGLYYMKDANIFISIPNSTVSSASEVIIISKPARRCININEANILSDMITILPHNAIFNQHVLVKFPLIKSKLHQDDQIELLYCDSENDGKYNWIRLQQYDTPCNHSDDIFWFTDSEYCYLFIQLCCHFLMVNKSGKEEEKALSLCTSVHGTWNKEGFNDLELVVGFHCPKCNQINVKNQRKHGMFVKSVPVYIFKDRGPVTISVEVEDEIWRNTVIRQELSADIMMLQCIPDQDMYYQSFLFLAKDDDTDLNKGIYGTVNLFQQGQSQGTIRFITSLGKLMQAKSMVEAGTNTEKICLEANENKSSTAQSGNLSEPPMFNRSGNPSENHIFKRRINQSEPLMFNRSDNSPEPQMFNKRQKLSDIQNSKKNIADNENNSCDESDSSPEQPDKDDSTNGSKICKRSTRDIKQELSGATGGYNHGNTTNIQIITNNVFSHPKLPHQYADLYGLPCQPKIADCIFNNYVLFEETKLCKILDSDCKEMLSDIAKSVGDLNGTVDMKNIIGLSLLQVWQTHVQSNKHTWKQFYDILIKLNCEAAAQQLKVVYEKDRLVSEIGDLRYYLRLKEILGLLLSKSVVDMSEKKKLVTMSDRDENEAVDYFVELLIGRDHKYLTKFHEVLYNDRYLKEWVHKLVLCSDELD